MIVPNIESSNLVLSWIENVRKDLPKTIQLGGNEAIVITCQGGYSNNVGMKQYVIQ